MAQIESFISVNLEIHLDTGVLLSLVVSFEHNLMETAS